MAGSTGRAVMAIWADAEAGIEDDFNAWYDCEHLMERVGVPGFLSGRRYRAAGRGRQRYFAVYETEGLEVFTSPPYLERLNNPTPWTTRIMAGFRNLSRSTCRVLADHGRGHGGVVATLRYRPEPAAAEALAGWLTGSALAEIRGRDAILRAQLWQADEASSTVRTRERALRRGDDGFSPWTIAVDAGDEAKLRAALAECLPAAGLRARGARSVRRNIYRYRFGIAH